MGKSYRMQKITTPEPDFMEKFMASLRADDRKELLCVGEDIRKEIEESIKYSAECWAAFTDEGQPIVLFGRTVLPERDGALIWCLGTDLLVDYWFPFLRESRKVLRTWAKEYGFLFNSVAEFNNVHLRWLSWLGAKFGQEIILNGESFLPFTLESEDI